MRGVGAFMPWKYMLAAGLAIVVLVYIWQTTSTLDESRFAWSLPLSGVVVVLDPGHGGVDGGASSKAGVLEKEVTLAISTYLRDYLQESGAFVMMTREGDYDLASEEARRRGRRQKEDLLGRVRQINDGAADVYISIHLNSIASQQWQGAQTFYHPQFETNKLLAERVQDELTRNLENTDRKAKMNQDLFILRHTEKPGILVEAGFLSNPQEGALLGTEEYQKKVAASIYEGVLRYYSEVDDQENNDEEETHHEEETHDERALNEGTHNEESVS